MTICSGKSQTPKPSEMNKVGTPDALDLALATPDVSLCVCRAWKQTRDSFCLTFLKQVLMLAWLLSHVKVLGNETRLS